jgi:heptosyltransferase I
MAIFSKAPGSICILRLSAIGDVCNVAAVVQMIQAEWPNTKITWIMGSLEAQLLSDIPNVEVIFFNKKLGFKGYLQIWKELSCRHFDALLHMQTALRASIVSLGVKATHRLGFDHQRSSDMQSLFINHKVNSPESMHVLDGFKAFAETLGVKSRPLSWNFPISEQNTQWALEKLGGKKSVIVVPAASKAYKNWTAQGYAEVIKHIQSKGFQVILAGSPAKIEIDLADNIVQLSNNKLVNLVAKSSLKEMLALLQQAKLVIAPDTGPAHMAVAVDTPVIGLYAHHNPQRTGPYKYRDYVVSVYQESIEAETGKKLLDLSWRSRVKNPLAMQRILSESVIQMFEKSAIDFSL